MKCMSRKFRFRRQPVTKLSDFAMSCYALLFPYIFNIEYVFTVDILLGYLSGDKFSLNMPQTYGIVIWAM